MSQPFEPISTEITLDEAVKLACAFTGRSEDEVFSAHYRSSFYISKTFKVDFSPFWEIQIAMADGVHEDSDGVRWYSLFPQPGGGKIVVFESGVVGSYADRIRDVRREHSRMAPDFVAAGTESAVSWWEARRGRFNSGLVVAGVLAFIAYAAVFYALSVHSRGGEITIITTLLQGLGYLVCMAVANVCYFAGPISESWLPDQWRATYRRYAYALGSWFCFALPFSIPVLLWVTYRSPQ